MVDLSSLNSPLAEQPEYAPGLAPAPNLAVQFFSGTEETTVNPRIVEIERELARLSRRLESARPDQDQALAVHDVATPSDCAIYRRGNFQSLGDTVPRGVLSAVPVSQNYEIPSQDSGRWQLAQWLTDPGNPLTPRVLVNRIWHHLFGNGLVRSVDYFGIHGESPSHGQLLDFLAVRFRDEERWSLKKTVRHMVLSHAYQMSSAHSSQGIQVDPDNRLLWRMPRRRLTAESIRDAMLAVSGELDRGRGGPALGLDLEGNIHGAGGTVNPATWGGIFADEIKKRRSIYLPLKRERPIGELEVLSTFDFPHPNEIVGARPQTTVATQALFLLNSPLVKQQAHSLSARLARDEPNDERARISRLYLLTFNRTAEQDEIDTALSFLDQCDTELERSAAWAQLCHALLGSNSFLFLE